MDIEIRIRTGERTRLDSGAVKWEDYKDARYLVTYCVDDTRALHEALFQVERILRDALGLPAITE
jgi:hypothetical protein